MRIGVLSDIHSNIYALEAVLKHGKLHGVQSWVNLGDILYGPIEPKLTYDCLHALDALTISGNQDREVHEASIQDRIANPTLDFVCNNLGDEPIVWLRSLAGQVIAFEKIYLCHGNPDNDLVYLLEDVTSGSPIVRDEQAIRAQLSSISQPLILCGHSHIPRTVTLVGGTLIVNPGSVGLPAYDDTLPSPHAMENYSPHARYTILDIAREPTDVLHCEVAYDWEKAARTAESHNRFDWATALRTGRVLT